MAGIAAIERSEGTRTIRKFLEKIKHRGGSGPAVYETDSATHGEILAAEPKEAASEKNVALDGSVYNWEQLCPNADSVHDTIETMYNEYGPGFVKHLDGPFAITLATEDGLFVARDPIGIAPLYEGVCEGDKCYASEVKALLDHATDIREFPPGHFLVPGEGEICFKKIKKCKPAEMSSDDAAIELRTKLANSVRKRVSQSGEVGSWLSGGLDSSTMAVLASHQIPKLKTFAVGVSGSPDLEAADVVARHIGSEHHELVVSLEEMLEALPQVIYHMESFDALLIRSSVMNFMVGKLSSDHVPSALSGEGGDELFAGYDYLQDIAPSDLADELVDITNRLHNTALQRVDRCSAAHGLVARTGFLDRDVVNLALRIPPEYKLRRNGGAVSKWVLRKAMQGLLPDEILNRPKAKFWEGSGVESLMEMCANDAISDEEFVRERSLPDGSILNTKEEMHYYRIFKEHFGELRDLSFMGRTKGAPIA